MSLRIIIPLMVVMVAGVWFLDSTLDAHFKENQTFVQECFHPSVLEIVFRSIISLALVAVGLMWHFSARHYGNIRQALVRSEKKYRSLVESAPDCIVVHTDNKIVFANQPALDFFQVPELAPFLGQSILPFIHPKFLDLVIQRQKIIFTTGKPSPSVEITLIRPDKSEASVLMNTAIIEYEGQPSLLTFFRDISAEVASRQTLEDSQERLQLAVGAARDGVWDWNIETGEMVYSQSWASILGYQLDSLKADQSTWQTLVHPDDFHRVQFLVQAHLKGDTPNYETEVRLRHHDGHYIWILDRGKVVGRDSEGNPVRMAGTHRDITARKEAEMALEIRNRLAEIFLTQDGPDIFSGLLEQVCQAVGCPAGMFGILSPKKSIRIIAALPILKGGNATTNPDFSIEEENLPDYFKECYTEKKSVIANREFSIPDNPLAISRALLVPIANGDQILGILMVANKNLEFTTADQSFLESIAEYLAPIMQSYLNSELKEAQLRQAQKMEALGALAGGIAHDFNNILQAILGFTTLAQGLTEPGSTISEDLSRVMKATHRGSDLVKRILLFSSREEQVRHPVPFQPIIVEALDLLRGTMPSTIEIKSRLPEEEYYIMADPSQISQAILNLATNSFHAMENEGGILEINLDFIAGGTSEFVVPEKMQDQDTLMLSIKDTGCGMDQNTIERLFDPFFTTKEVGKGTGLGLSVVHGIITSHGGDVTIISEKGIGTIVRLFLPLHEDANREVEGVIPTPAGTPQGLRILFVDDEEEIAILGKALLENQGFRVTTLHDGPAALKLIEEQPAFFDLIVTDQTMPRLTGLQFAQKVAAFRDDLPFVLITGLSEQTGNFWKEEPSIKGVVFKPFSGDKLCQVVNRVLLESKDRG